MRRLRLGRLHRGGSPFADITPNRFQEAFMSKQSKVLAGRFALLLGACQGEGTTLEVDNNGDLLEVVTTPVEADSDASLTSGGLTGGMAETVHTSGSIDRTNPFFQ